MFVWKNEKRSKILLKNISHVHPYSYKTHAMAASYVSEIKFANTCSWIVKVKIHKQINVSLVSTDQIVNISNDQNKSQSSRICSLTLLPKCVIHILLWVAKTGIGHAQIRYVAHQNRSIFDIFFANFIWFTKIDSFP